MSERINIKILVAPLDWGLGHATRCIPIITQLLYLGCKVIIAAEGAQEKLLKAEFPDLAFVHLPGYRISYSKNKRFFSAKIILQLPKLFVAVRREKKWLQSFVSKTRIDAVISDNRYGLHLPALPAVFITHQLLIKAPFAIAEKILQKINYMQIQKFSTCWVPDDSGKVSLAGLLSHPSKLPKVPVEYLGGLSRLTKRACIEKQYDILVILSGPEPQRSLLEKKILTELAVFEGTVLLVRGLPGNEEVINPEGKFTIKSHLRAHELEKAFCESQLIISRSGYTTVMDICKLQKNAVLIPTPGQTEQEFLAAHLQEQGWCIAISQDEFSLSELLIRVKNFRYKLPQLNMEAYKYVVADFVKKLKS